ncbi:MAG: alpha/beta fold hydrolase [Alphaproteobacteria bacterium]|nr:alpha/beta fold hydrolase [Alphaproteobacteria bacterium]
MTKTPLLLVPGHLCDAALWSHQIRYLADIADMTVADTDGGSTMAAMARAILAKAPPRFALAGLSMGGYLAFEIMRQAPQRVERLALLDTMASGNTPASTERRKRMMDLLRADRFDAMLEEFKPLLIHPARLGDLELMGDIDAMTRRIGPRLALDQQQAMLDRADALGLLPRIACPTLVLCGRQDALTPLVEHEKMAKGIPGARLVIIEDCGHLAPMEMPEAVTAVMRYWLQG